MDHLKMRKKRQNNRPVFLGVAETVVGSRLFYGVGKLSSSFGKCSLFVLPANG